MRAQAQLYAPCFLSALMTLSVFSACNKSVTAVRSQRVALAEPNQVNESNETNEIRAGEPSSSAGVEHEGAGGEPPLPDQGSLEQDLSIEQLDSGVGGQALDLSVTEEEPTSCEPWAAQGCERWRRFGDGSRALAPIMLVHGFFGWGDNHAFDYFYRVPQLLHERGYRVFVAELDPINSSELRSGQLAEQLDEALACSCAEKVNLIAHSQGGIDARYLLGPLERAHLVESITTISTPHRGFSLASQGARGDALGLEFVEMLTALSSELIRGNPERPHDLRATLYSMSIEARAAYDDEWPDPTHVPIYSFAGITNPLADGGDVCAQGERPPPSRGDLIEPALVASYWMLGGFDTPNDGVVPAASCIWGRFLGCLASDHFDQVGQIFGVSDFDHERFYLNHASFLEEQGH